MTNPDRPNNADELRGFNMALACMMRWGSQIERQTITLGGAEDMIPRSQMQRHGGRMVRGCAEALALTMGQPARVQPAATVIPIAPRRLLKSG